MDLVEFNQEAICIIDSFKIEELIKNALQNKSGKYRLCLHSNDQCMLHESIIVTTKNDHSHFIHKHAGTSEFNMIIKGRLLIILFDEAGNIDNAFVLEEGKKLLYRIESGKYHLAVPLGEVAVFLETKQGPFMKDDNILPKWRKEDNSVYMQKAMQMIFEAGGNKNDIL